MESSADAGTLGMQFAAMAMILCGSTIIITISLRLPHLRPDRSWFVLFKVFSAGALLATTVVHSEVQSDFYPPSLPLSRFRSPEFAWVLSAVAAIVLRSIAGPRLMHPGAGLLKQRLVSVAFQIVIVLNSIPMGYYVGMQKSSTWIKKVMFGICLNYLIQGMCLGASISEAQFVYGIRIFMAILYVVSLPLMIGVFMIFSKQLGHLRTFSILDIIFAGSSSFLNCSAMVEMLLSELTGPRVQQNWRLHLSSCVVLLVGGVVGFAVSYLH